MASEKAHCDRAGEALENGQKTFQKYTHARYLVHKKAKYMKAREKLLKSYMKTALLSQA